MLDVDRRRSATSQREKLSISLFFCVLPHSQPSKSLLERIVFTVARATVRPQCRSHEEIRYRQFRRLGLGRLSSS